MGAPRPGRRPNDLGPTGERVADTVREKRDEERPRLSTRDLAQRLADPLSRPIAATGITKIEAKDRRVDADDLVALALALNVSPLRLLLPAERADYVQLTPGVAVDWEAAWHWATGERPLPLDGETEVDERAVEAFQRENQPHLRRARSRELREWEERLAPRRAALRQVSEESGAPPAVVRGYVDFWIAAYRALAPIRRMAESATRTAREMQEARERGEWDELEEAPGDGR